MKLTRAYVAMGASLFGGAMLLPLQEASAQGAAAAILEEVVVTARRREESLEDLPLSVVAISAEAMQAQGIYTTDQIGDFAANVSLSQSDRMNHSRIFIRGIGGGFPNPVAVFGTGMYIDGHYLPGSLANYMSTVDIERVEVLRGPQGTLFGRNVTGGAINIISAKPGPEFESSLTVRAGQYGQQDIRGMLNVPISDNLYFRGSISNEQLDGYWDNMFLGIDGTDWRDSTNFRGALRWLPNDNWTVDMTAQIGRDRHGQLGRQCRVHAQPGIVADMLANGYTQAEIDAVNPNIVPDDPSTSFTDGVGRWGGANPNYPGGHIDRLSEQIASNGVSVNGVGSAGGSPDRSVLTMWDWCNRMSAAGDYVNASEKESFSDADNNNIFVSAAWNSDGPVGGLDNLEIRTNFSLRNSRFNWIVDRDMTPLSVDNLGHVDEGDGTNITTNNFEMIFDMEVNERLNALVGLYLFNEKTRTGDGNCYPKWEEMTNQYDGTRDPATGRIIPAERLPGDPDGVGLQVFGERPCGPNSGGGGHGGLVFEFLPDRAFPGGPGNAFQNVNLINDSTAVFGHLTYNLNDDWDLELGARWTEDDRFFNIIEFDTGTGSTNNTCNYIGNRLCQPSPILNYQNVVQEGFFNQAREVFDEVTTMVSLTRNLTPTESMDSGMIYFLYSEGFLSGSFNDELNIFLTPQLIPLVTYQPENVSNYEVGFKGTFNGGRVRLNADIFFMDYENKQEAIEIDNFDGRFGPDPAIGLTQNAGQVDIYGLELELRASPWDGGFLSVDASYLVNEYNSFIVDDIDNPGQTIDFKDNAIGDRTPDWTLNFNIGHTFQLNNGGSLTAQTGFYAQGEYEWLAGGGQNPLNGEKSVCHQDSYSNWRARLTYEPAAANWQASLFGSNITDERFFQECDYARTGVYDYRYAPPSAWGLEFIARWGE